MLFGLETCGFCGRSGDSVYLRLCHVCEVCLRESFHCRTEHFHTRFVGTVLMLREEERVAFAESFYAMVAREDEELPPSLF